LENRGKGGVRVHEKRANRGAGVLGREKKKESFAASQKRKERCIFFEK